MSAFTRYFFGFVAVFEPVVEASGVDDVGAVVVVDICRLDLGLVVVMRLEDLDLVFRRETALGVLFIVGMTMAWAKPFGDLA